LTPSRVETGSYIMVWRTGSTGHFAENAEARSQATFDEIEAPAVRVGVTEGDEEVGVGRVAGDPGTSTDAASDFQRA
jgi:hypothetical protein